MMQNIIKTYWFSIAAFTVYVCILYLLQLNANSPLPYVNIITYFIGFLIIKETLPRTQLNKSIIQLFYYFFLYLAIFSSFPIVFRDVDSVNFIVYVYYEIILKVFILTLSILIVSSSFVNLFKTESQRLTASFLFAMVVIGFNFYKFIQNPSILTDEAFWPIWQVSNYVSMVVSVIGLLIFWVRYYQRYFVVTEYLNLIIFIFTISNVIEVLHFIAYQHELQVFINGQIISLVLNCLMLLLWYLRLLYLNKEISTSNERYLMNFKYLNGIVSKPKVSMFNWIMPFLSTRLMTAGAFAVVFLIMILYLINKITFYLLLNTGFILLAGFFALFFSFLSIKRDWQDTVGTLLKDNKRVDHV